MKIALAGAGAFGIKHLEALARIDGVEVVSLVGRVLDKTREVAAKVGVKHVTTNLAESLAIKEADAVILCTPTQMHAAQAIACINTIQAEIVDENGNQALPGENRLRSGVCGHAIKWAGLNMVRKLKKLREKFNYNFQIIGVGGVTTADDFFEYREAGADFVMSATGAMWNPYLAKEIKERLG